MVYEQGKSILAKSLQCSQWNCIEWIVSSQVIVELAGEQWPRWQRKARFAQVVKFVQKLEWAIPFNKGTPLLRKIIMSGLCFFNYCLWVDV